MPMSEPIPAPAASRADKLIDPALAGAMARLEWVFGRVCEDEIDETISRAELAAEARGQSLDTPQGALIIVSIRAETEAAYTGELDALLDVLSGNVREVKAHEQARLDAAAPEGPCPVCFAPPASSRAPGAGGHATLPHQVTDERGARGYVPCQCRDGDSGPCVRAASHVGACAMEHDRNPSLFSPPFVSFVCRSDDAEPHELVS